MASTYPVTLDSLPTTHSDATNEVIHAATDNDQSDAINHIEIELGVIPKGVYASVAARLARLEYIEFNDVNASSYTCILADATRCVNMIFGPGTSTVIIPNSANVNYQRGTVILIRQAAAAGQVTVQGASGVTLHEVNNSFQTQGPNAWLQAIKNNTGNDWDITGATA